MDSLKEALVAFLDSQAVVYLMFFYLLCLVFYIIYSMLNYFKYYSRVRKTIQSLYSQMSDQEKQRAEAERQQRDIHGEGSKKDFLASIDEKLDYSGIKDKLKWMTTEIWLLTIIVLTVIIGTISVVANGLLVGLATYVIVPLIFELIISGLIMARNKKTESQMLQFMNILDNFSKTSDDLISILEKSSRYIDDPLGGQIYDAVIAARNTGDTQQAMTELQNSVKNKHFKVLMRNLEISSRFETNYADIVEDCRELFHTYIQSEREKRSLRQNGVVQIITMMLMGAFCINILGGISESGNILVAFQKGGILGTVILGILILSLIISLYLVIFKIIKYR